MGLCAFTNNLPPKFQQLLSSHSAVLSERMAVYLEQLWR